MPLLSQTYEMNGPSVSLGAFLLVPSIFASVVGILMGNISLCIYGFGFLILSISLFLSQNVIIYNKKNHHLDLIYRNLYRKEKMTYKVKENDHLSIKFSGGSYYVQLHSPDEKPLPIEEFVHLRNAVRKGKKYAKTIGIPFEMSFGRRR